MTVPGNDSTRQLEDTYVGSQDTHVPVLEKTIRIIDYLATCSEGATLAELARELGIPKTTAFRILATLRKFGYAAPVPGTQRVALGPSLVHIGLSAFRRLDLVTLAQPIMQALMEELGETVKLSALGPDGKVYCIDRVEPNTGMKLSVAIGSVAPIHAGGASKVLLAHLPPGKRKAILSEPLPRYTVYTITDPVELEAELERIRREGYALDQQEYAEGVEAVAAPVRDSFGRVVAALSVAYISSPTKREQRGHWVQRVMEAAGLISSHLGYSANGVKPEPERR